MQKKLPSINSVHGSETRNIINEIIKAINDRGLEILSESSFLSWLEENGVKHQGEWDNEKEYDRLSVVLHEGNSYTSKKQVPAGIDILNKEFWVVTGNYDAQMDVVNVKLSEKVNKGELIFNIKDFGALGDGETDDSLSFTSALQNGGNIYIPEGTFNIKNTISLNSNTRIYGSPKSKIINNTSNELNIFEIINKENITIEGINFVGNGGVSTDDERKGCAIYGYGVKNLKIKDNSFTYFSGSPVSFRSDSASIYSGENVYITRNYFNHNNNPQSSDISFYRNVKNIFINENISLSNNDTGIEIVWGENENIFIYDNISNNHIRHGITASYTLYGESGQYAWESEVNVSNNKCSNNGQHGISVNIGTLAKENIRTKIIGNTCKNNSKDTGNGVLIGGIRVVGASNIIVSDNISLYNNAEDTGTANGIIVLCDEAIISNNIVSYNDLGVKVIVTGHNTENIIINGNTIIGNTKQYGIFLEGSDTIENTKQVIVSDNIIRENQMIGIYSFNIEYLLIQSNIISNNIGSSLNLNGNKEGVISNNIIMDNSVDTERDIVINGSSDILLNGNKISGTQKIHLGQSAINCYVINNVIKGMTITNWGTDNHLNNYIDGELVQV